MFYDIADLLIQFHNCSGQILSGDYEVKEDIHCNERFDLEELMEIASSFLSQIVVGDLSAKNSHF